MVRSLPYELVELYEGMLHILCKDKNIVPLIIRWSMETSVDARMLQALAGMGDRNKEKRSLYVFSTATSVLFCFLGGGKTLLGGSWLRT